MNTSSGQSSPGEIRTLVNGSKGHYAWPLHHRASAHACLCYAEVLRTRIFLISILALGVNKFSAGLVWGRCTGTFRLVGSAAPVSGRTRLVLRLSQEILSEKSCLVKKL